jgi:hypothetical protein
MTDEISEIYPSQHLVNPSLISSKLKTYLSFIRECGYSWHYVLSDCGVRREEVSETSLLDDRDDRGSNRFWHGVLEGWRARYEERRERESRVDMDRMSR